MEVIESMNKCHFMGWLTRDPEIRYTQSDQPGPVAHYTYYMQILDGEQDELPFN